MQNSSSAGILLRQFGRADAKVSILGFGGHHLGDAPDEKTAVRIVQEAVDNGITFYDNCWEYRRGKTELWMGAGLKGRRDKVFLMTKTCPHGRDASLALQMLEESLRRLQTDHLDLWQVHGMAFENDPELFIRQNGAAEALAKAKKDGKAKARFVGFSGHQNPMVHLGMLNTGFPFDSVQMPLNAFDYSFTRSFERQVLPELNRRGIAVLGMKPLNGHEEMTRFQAVAPLHTIQPPYNLFEREIERDVLPYALGHGITTLTYGALCRGLLSGTMSADRQFEKDDMRKTTDPKFQSPHFAEYLKAASKLDAFARENFDKRLIHLAIRWLHDQPGVGVALWGARRPEQLAPINEVSGWTLTKRDFAAIDAILRESILNPVGPEFMAPPARETVRPVTVSAGQSQSKNFGGQS